MIKEGGPSKIGYDDLWRPALELRFDCLDLLVYQSPNVWEYSAKERADVIPVVC